jgi:hypothetical protein
MGINAEVNKQLGTCLLVTQAESCGLSRENRGVLIGKKVFLILQHLTFLLPSEIK